MENATVKQYSARLNLPNHSVVDIVGDDANIVKENVQALMKGGCRFEPLTSSPGTGTLIFHPTLDGGKKALGWITVIEIPAHMAVKTWTERGDRVAA
jgi:hypothetical protein